VPRSHIPKTAAAGVALLMAAGGGMGAVAYIDVAVASVIFFTYPIFVAIVNHLRGTTRLSLAEIILIAMAFVGVALALGLQRRSLDGLNYTGPGLAFLSSVGITTVILTTTATTAALSAVRANLHMNVWGLIYFAALALVLPALGLAGETVYLQTAAAWLYVLLAALGFTLGYLLFFVAAKILGATEASVLSILELVFMILVSVTIVGERLTALQTTGLLVVVVSLVGFELVSARKG
jgi:drug/metabolite transporter (DMT)-like permease